MGRMGCYSAVFPEANEGGAEEKTNATESGYIEENADDEGKRGNHQRHYATEGLEAWRTYSEVPECNVLMTHES